ncbi:MAG: F0F1 ATP synthase subunit B [Bacteroidetes bacterium]|nr:F0F1 ATP synthase subunit B [Bacteroidota bacterium]
MLEINPGLIVWTIITFVIAVVILRAAAWKPILEVLSRREERIRGQLSQAERAQEEAQRLLEENKRQLSQAEEQSQRIIRQGREAAEKMKSEIVEQANTSARSMVDQAKEEIEREKETALQHLRSEVADLAIGAAGKILDANLDTPKQRKLVDAVIKDINEGGKE